MSGRIPDERAGIRRDRARRRGAGRGLRRPARRRRACRWRSSSSTWSAASAPTTPACPRRRCCAPPTCSTRRAGCRASPRRSRGDLDPQAVLDRRDEVIHDLDDSGQLPWLEEHGIELFRGEGKLDGERRVLVGDDVLTARRVVVVATGSGAAMPPIEGLDSVRAWNNRDATTSKQVPASMVVLGGGPVGSELAQAWSTPRHRGHPDRGRRAAAARARSPSPASRSPTALREKHGVDVRTGALAQRVRPGGAGVDRRAGRRQPGRRPPSCWSRSAASRAARASASSRSGSSPARAASWRPTTGCGSAAATGSTRSATSTAAPSSPTWASTRPGSPPRTRSGARSRRSPKASAHPGSPSPTPRSPPSARPSPRPRKPGSRRPPSTSPPTAPPAPASRARDTGGTSRIVVDEARKTIVGATFTGFETADFLHAATVAIVGEVPLDRLRHAVAAYPTRSEIWLKLLEAYGL